MSSIMKWPAPAVCTVIIALFVSSFVFAQLHEEISQEKNDNPLRTGIKSYEIRLKSRQFVPMPSEVISLSQKDGNTRRYVLLQFTELPGAEDLARDDIKVLNYVRNHAIMASVPPQFDQRLIPNLRWMGQLQPSDKISREVATQLHSVPSTFVVEAFRDVASEELESTIKNLGGSVVSHPTLPAHIRLVNGSSEIISRLANEEKIAWIMPASETLIHGQSVYYCPGPITPYGPIPNFVTHDDGWDGPGQSSAFLTYYFVNGTPDINGTGEETAVGNALAEWAKYVQLTFARTTSSGQLRSFDILWGVGEHGDGYPFDGLGSVLAHAFYPAPPNSESIGGDIHFDEAETWSLTGDIHMFAVALHEAGHSLGLAHSNVSQAVMYPFYSGPVAGLHLDDIAGIQTIYAAPGSPPANLVLQNLTLNTNAVFEATNSITAGPSVNVLSGANVTFHVVNTNGTGFILKPGFTAATGCTFRAYIGSGTSSTAKAEGPVVGLSSTSNPAEISKVSGEENSSHFKRAAETIAIPQEFSLAQNYPNPFNPTTTLKYDLPQPAEVRLKVVDMQGRHVRTLVNQSQPAGRYAITWDGRNEQGQQVASGTFIYQLRAIPATGAIFVQTRRMALVR